jgi:hypothetical protein
VGLRSGSSLTKGNAKTVKARLRRTKPSIVMVRCVAVFCVVAVEVDERFVVAGCAYKKGLCSMCGKQILDTTGYVMSSK